MEALIPGWFCERMMGDAWYFGLLTTHGEVIAINSISNIYQSKDGAIWLDVEMLTKDEVGPNMYKGLKIISAPTSRTMASINTNNIVAAFELADT